MQTVKFVRDFRGMATKEHYFQAGEVVDFPYLDSPQLIAEGAVELVEETEPEVIAVEAGPDLDNLTVAELREIAQERGISYSGLRKAELVEALK